MIPAAVRIFVCAEPVDMRQGFDRLAQAVKVKLGEDPQSGSLFVFANRGATRLKVLWFAVTPRDVRVADAQRDIELDPDQCPV